MIHPSPSKAVPLELRFNIINARRTALNDVHKLLMEKIEQELAASPISPMEEVNARVRPLFDVARRVLDMAKDCLEEMNRLGSEDSADG